MIPYRRKDHQTSSSIEDVEQECLFIWARFERRTHPQLALLHHIPNGGKRDKKTGAKLKKLGVLPGIPDLCLPVARAGYYGLYIELKKAGIFVGSRQQEEILKMLRSEGYRAVVCGGWESARDTIIEYLRETPTMPMSSQK